MKFLIPDKYRFTWQLALPKILNKLRLITLLLFLITQVTLLQGQDIRAEKPVFPKFNIGFGMGIDYGGFGTQVSLVTSERIELFGAVGYNLLGAGFNFGADYRVVRNSRICPYYGLMYGYNAVIITINGTDISGKTYYGPSFKFGLECWSRRRPHFFNIELIVPVRSNEYHDSIKDLRNNQDIKFENEPFSIGVSIGYHFVL